MLTLIAKKGLTHAQIPEKFLKCPSMKKKALSLLNIKMFLKSW